MEGEEKTKKVAKEKRSVKKSKAVVTAHQGNPSSASSGKTRGAEDDRHWDREAPSSLQSSKGTELRTGSASCLLYWRATQELGNLRG